MMNRNRKNAFDDNSEDSSSDFDITNWGENPFWNEEVNDDDEDDEDDNDDIKYNQQVAGAQHILLLIDCNSKMFDKCMAASSNSNDHDHDRDKSNEKIITPFDASLKAAEQLLQCRIQHVATAQGRGGRRDGVGVLLYNTRRRRCVEEDRHVAGKRYRGDGDMVEDEEDEEDESSSDEDDASEETPDPESNESHPMFKDDLDNRGGVTTFELIKLAPPGVTAVLELQKCLPRKKKRRRPYYDPDSSGRYEYFPGSSEEYSYSGPPTLPVDNDLHNKNCVNDDTISRERDLRHEFENKLNASFSIANTKSILCSLRVALQAASKIFHSAK